MAAVNKDAADGAPAEKFEDSLDELESIVSQLESGAKPLEESLALYEKGIAALRKCHGILDKAEKRIKLLVRGANGEPIVGDAEGFGEEQLESQKPKTPGQKATKESSRRDVAAEDDDLTDAERAQKTAGLAIDKNRVKQSPKNNTLFSGEQ